MMNNTNTTVKITVSKTAPWAIFIDGKPYSGTFPSRAAARKEVASLKENGIPEQYLADADLPTGEELRAARREHKWSLKAAAQAMGLSEYHVWHVEKGNLPVTPEYVEHQARLIG